jgi:hypothetical protein
VTITDTNRDLALLPKFFGLSTDTKASKAPVGSSFYETDTKFEFVFDGADWIRTKTVKVEQTEAVEVKEVRTTDELLGEILAQMKINNAHLAVVTGSELNEEDIDASN